MKNFQKLFLLFFLMLPLTALQAQEEAPEAPKNWYHLDLEQDQYPGISLEQAYKLLKGRKGKPVVVAIIDGGVEVDHEDLADNMWVNEKEKPDNGKDDDKNGYVDDIYGWDFIGGADGQDVHFDNLEITRLFAQYKERFKGKSREDIPEEERQEYELYKRLRQEYEAEINELKEPLEYFTQVTMRLEQTIPAVQKALGKEEFTLEDLEKLETEDEQVNAAKEFLVYVMNQGVDPIQTLVESKEGLEYYKNQVDYHYNLEFKSRDIVGDNYDNKEERFYGNNEVEGPDGQHGTHVAGLVGAVRKNKKGIEGVTDFARLMAIRTVPDGDERDKDVANAIRYAADNGARVINMSFGKSYSPHKKVVDEAVKYAESKGVLLIHAAGNDGANLDDYDNYPNKNFGEGKVAQNWITVGASTYFNNEKLPATFSNYSETKVDIFAPGYSIYSTVPDNGYEDLQGTSMAAPIVSGVAALLMAYFPDLDAQQVKKILLESAVKYDIKVNQPGSRGPGAKQVDFATLSKTGGVVNAHEAVKMAMEMSK